MAGGSAQNIARQPITVRLSEAESAAAFMSDLWSAEFTRNPDGKWQTIPDPNAWGIDPLPIVMAAEGLIELAAHYGWRT